MDLMLVPRLISAFMRLKDEPKLRRDVGIMGVIFAVGCAIGGALGVDIVSVIDFVKGIIGL